MEPVKIISVKDNVLSENDKEAATVRAILKEKNIFFINLMSSPGSGKTTFLCSLLPLLQEKGYRCLVLEADIDGDVDAKKIIEKTAARSYQVHTMGACHLTAQMTHDSISKIDLDNVDILILENIGNLVCPAEFDTGSNLNMMLLSVPEGDDKPLKYPLMFKVSPFVIVTKMDVLPVFNFNFDDFQKRVEALRPDSMIHTISAKNKEGLDDVINDLLPLIEAKIKKA